MSILSTFPRPFLEGTSKQFTLTLLASGWQNQNGALTQTLAVPGITSLTNGDLSLSHLASVEQRAQARGAQLAIVNQQAGNITIVVDGEAPTIDIPVIVTIFPKAAAEGEGQFALEMIEEHKNTPNLHLLAFDPVADEGKILGIIDGALAWNKTGLDTDSQVDPLVMLTEGGFINPAVNKNNAIYIDENGAIFSI